MKESSRWFYPFVFKDGTQANCWLPADILPLHDTRKKALAYFLEKFNPMGAALDLACHQGYFSLILERHFENVIGIDRYEQSIKEAEFVSNDLGIGKCTFVNSTIEDYNVPADFVLCFGVLYHTENPISFLRKVGQLTKKSCIIETQVIAPSTPHIEDGTFKTTRDAVGTFALTMDYPDDYLGGITELAMVPDINALRFMLKHLGFNTVEIYEPTKGDYEQFTRKQRVIVYAER